MSAVDARLSESAEGTRGFILFASEFWQSRLLAITRAVKKQKQRQSAIVSPPSLGRTENETSPSSISASILASPRRDDDDRPIARRNRPTGSWERRSATRGAREAAATAAVSPHAVVGIDQNANEGASAVSA